MILIQILLVAGFAVLLIRFLAGQNNSKIKAWKKILGALFAGMAVIAVLFPEVLDWVAHKLGVGRGADLLLYTLTLAFIASLLNGYVRRKQEQYQIVQLVRKVAILEVNENQK